MACLQQQPSGKLVHFITAKLRKIIQNYEKKLWNASTCDTDNIECLRSLSANKVLNACQSDKCIAKSIHKSETVGVPETLFNAFRNVSTIKYFYSTAK